MTASHHEKSHPTPKTYVKIAIFLAIVTAVEIAISYIKMPDWAAVVSLIVLAIIKFFAVAAWFMHLKFDNPALRKPFYAGLITAILIYSVVVINMTMHDNIPA